MLPLEMFEQGVASSERFSATSSVAGVRTFPSVNTPMSRERARVRKCFVTGLAMVRSFPGMDTVMNCQR